MTWQKHKNNHWKQCLFLCCLQEPSCDSRRQNQNDLLSGASRRCRYAASIDFVGVANTLSGIYRLSYSVVHLYLICYKSSGLTCSDPELLAPNMLGEKISAGRTLCSAVAHPDIRAEKVHFLWHTFPSFFVWFLACPCSIARPPGGNFHMCIWKRIHFSWKIIFYAYVKRELEADVRVACQRFTRRPALFRRPNPEEGRFPNEVSARRSEVHLRG